MENVRGALEIYLMTQQNMHHLTPPIQDQIIFFMNDIICFW